MAKSKKNKNDPYNQWGTQLEFIQALSRAKLQQAQLEAMDIATQGQYITYRIRLAIAKRMETELKNILRISSAGM